MDGLSGSVLVLCTVAIKSNRIESKTKQKVCAQQSGEVHQSLSMHQCPADRLQDTISLNNGILVCTHDALLYNGHVNTWMYFCCFSRCAA